MKQVYCDVCMEDKAVSVQLYLEHGGPFIHGKTVYMDLCPKHLREFNNDLAKIGDKWQAMVATDSEEQVESSAMAPLQAAKRGG